ncbi:conserved hypothetical protein [Ricinus communis]|uniref:DUF247 domain-containing protein n=2 Tax=Ricinus communis TaxID=3988 RepID=B9RI91_RICCO|nr:conserved hypothetical protein [Ricinus communis]|eukprot:XP_025012110.1 UPF0481 protein At3g47200-like [Ricinus communis]
MSVRNELEVLHSLSDDCCIHRVPKRLRQLNEKAYTPRAVSIGALHHGKQELKAMEEHKRRYLRDFLEWSKASVEDCIKLIKDNEIRLRNCYSETIGLNSENFVKMILLDAAFIIMVLLKQCLKEFRSKKDRIFSKPGMIGDVRFDILLLENQIPFFILDDLFKLSTNSEGHEELSMIVLTHKFFTDTFDSWVAKHILDEHDFSKIEHMVDFLRVCQQPPKLQNRKKLKKLIIPSVTELHQAGVKFELGSSRKLLNIKFNRGILKVPSLQIDDNTEILLRNLQAFEQCLCDRGNYVSDYISLVSLLVKAPKDVDLLAQNGIIENWLVNSEGVSTLFQKLEQENLLIPDDFYFSSLVEELNSYCKNPWNKWKATLKQDYFNTPWAVISVIAAAILLILTVIQSVCSILQVLI